MVSDVFRKQKSLRVFTFNEVSSGSGGLDLDIVHVTNAFNQVPFLETTKSCSGTLRDHSCSQYDRINMHNGALDWRKHKKPFCGVGFEFVADSTDSRWPEFRQRLSNLSGAVMTAWGMDQKRHPGVVGGDICLALPEEHVLDPTLDESALYDLINNELYVFLREYCEEQGVPELEVPKKEYWRSSIIEDVSYFKSLSQYKYQVHDDPFLSDFRPLNQFYDTSTGLNLDIYHVIDEFLTVAFICPTTFQSGTPRDVGVGEYQIYTFPEGECNAWIELKTDHDKFPELEKILRQFSAVEVFSLDEPKEYGLCTKRIQVTVPEDQKEDLLWLTNFWNRDFYLEVKNWYNSVKENHNERSNLPY
jgi:hypothetical protein